MDKLISIDKNLAFKEVNKHTSYRASKLDATTFDLKRYKDIDATFLDVAWHEGTDALSHFFTPYISSQEMKDYDGTGHFDLSLSLPDDFREAVFPSVCSRCFTFVVWYLLFRWYSMIGDDEAATIAQASYDSMESSIKKALTYRVKKVHLSSHPF